MGYTAHQLVQDFFHQQYQDKFTGATFKNSRILWEFCGKKLTPRKIDGTGRSTYIHPIKIKTNIPVPLILSALSPSQALFWNDQTNKFIQRNLCYQPKQGTTKGKSFKNSQPHFRIHLIPPQNGSHLMFSVIWWGGFPKNIVFGWEDVLPSGAETSSGCRWLDISVKPTKSDCALVSTRISQKKTRKVKNQIQMMSPEKSVNEINPYFTNLVLKRFKKTVQKTYSLRWLPWILVAKMLVTIGFNVGFHLYPWSAVDQTSRGSLDLDFLGYNFHPLNPCGSIRQVGFDRRLRTGVLGNSRSLQVVIT